VGKEKTQRLRVVSTVGATVVELTDRRILDEVSINEIGEQISLLIAASAHPRFVLDFSGVAHLSSTALGMLITLHKRIREKGGELRLCGIQPAILEVFVITRLNEILKITSTQQESIDSLL